MSLPAGMMGSDKCTALTHPSLLAAEDFEHIGGGKFLIASGDMSSFVFLGRWDAEAGPRGTIPEGGLFLVDVNTKPATLSPVPMKGFPGELFFLAHGSYYSNATQQFYVVNHGFAQGGERVIIFKVHHDPVISVEYVRSVTSDLFGDGQLNDVVEGNVHLNCRKQLAYFEHFALTTCVYNYPPPKKTNSKIKNSKPTGRNGNEILVTQFLQKPLPPSGVTNEDGSNALLSGDPKLGGGKIFRCVWKDDADARCKTAFTGGRGPNGITKKVTTTGAEFFVTDPFIDQLYTFKMSDGHNSAQEDGQLIEAGKIKTPLGCDNLFYDAEGDFLSCGANLDLASCFQLFGHDHKKTLVKTNHPGTNMRMIPPNDNNKAWVIYPHYAMHDGTQQKMASTAISYGSITLFGSPTSTGILVCDSTASATAKTPKEEL